jgi:hypothetical protein
MTSLLAQSVCWSVVKQRVPSRMQGFLPIVFNHCSMECHDIQLPLRNWLDTHQSKRLSLMHAMSERSFCQNACLFFFDRGKESAKKVWCGNKYKEEKAYKEHGNRYQHHAV